MLIKNNERQSNFEVLRIIAMAFIVLHHICIHTLWNTDIFHPEELSLNVAIIQGFLPLGKIGVNLFVLISGYFLVTINRSPWLKIAIIWSQLLLYSIIIAFIFYVVLGYDYTEQDLYSTITPWLSNTWWFATTYLFMLALSPFINKVIYSIDRKSHLKLIIGLVAVWSIVGSLLNRYLEYTDLGWFITLYIVAAYVRLYPESLKKSSHSYFVIAFIIYCLLLAVEYAIDMTGFIIPFLGGEDYVIHNNASNSIFIASISLFVFLGFTKWDCVCISRINCIAATMFGVYLLHDHPLVRSTLYSKVFQCSNYTFSEYLIGYILLVASIILIIGIIVELFRIRLIAPIYEKNVQKYEAYISKRIDLILEKLIQK